MLCIFKVAIFFNYGFVIINDVFFMNQKIKQWKLLTSFTPFTNIVTKICGNHHKVLQISLPSLDWQRLVITLAILNFFFFQYEACNPEHLVGHKSHVWELSLISYPPCKWVFTLFKVHMPIMRKLQLIFLSRKYLMFKKIIFT
jgi:hypothetical protein